VEVEGQFILLGPDAPADGSVPAHIAPNSRYDLVLRGNGFFVSGHYIVTAAQLVLMNPTWSSVLDRYTPGHRNPDCEGLFIKNEMVQANRILVTVNDVNCCGKSFVYQAVLIGVDGANNLAVLKIDYNKPWNKCNPCIEKRHTFFHFGCSRESCIGSTVYLIGNILSSGPIDDPSTKSVTSFVDGVLANNRYLDSSGDITAEVILVDTEISHLSTGLPIIDCEGKVIGMKVTSDCLHREADTSVAVGVSQFFMQEIIRLFVDADLSVSTDNHRLGLISDPIGNFFYLIKSYLGISYEVFDGSNYASRRNFISGEATSNATQLSLQCDGNLLETPCCKQIAGIVITGIAGANPQNLPLVPDGANFVPGGSFERRAGGTNNFEPNDFPTSSILGTLHCGDNIITLCDVTLGNTDEQVAPSLITTRTKPGTVVKITYRVGGNLHSQSEENYCELRELHVSLGTFPLGLDYPFYSVCFLPEIDANTREIPKVDEDQKITPGGEEIEHHRRPRYPGIHYPVDQKPYLPLFNSNVMGSGCFAVSI
jgi:S1-C subfamily serine protease